MPEAFRIGELSRRSGRSIHTIRWYEAQGLMPGVTRDAGGRRVYASDHVIWLELVDRLRLTGMSVAEIRAYARHVREGRAGRPRLRDILAAHAAETGRRIEDLREAKSFIERKIRFYDDWITTGVRPAIPKRPKPRP
ncbi:MAG: MerR family transcriptional regulator [Hyphomicrobiales bacterium]|nr:MAG: MerR family transcriptional regulator [Hyphomicrobiales bacterium]